MIDQVHTRWGPGTLGSRVSRESLCELLQLGRPTRYPDGTALAHQGDPPSAVHFICRGLVKETAAAPNGAEMLVSVRSAGDLIGDLAVLRGSAQPVTATTCGHVEVNTVQGGMFLDLLKRCPEAAIAEAQVAIERLARANQRRLEYNSYNVTARLALMLLELARRHGSRTPSGVELGVPLSQAEIASLIGAREDTVQKALRTLQQQGFVIKGRRRIVLLDLVSMEIRYSGWKEDED